MDPITSSTPREIATLLGSARPYDPGRDSLYTVDELMAGYESDAPMQSLDARLAAHIKASGVPSEEVDEAIAPGPSRSRRRPGYAHLRRGLCRPGTAHRWRHGWGRRPRGMPPAIDSPLRRRRLSPKRDFSWLQAEASGSWRRGTYDAISSGTSVERFTASLTGVGAEVVAVFVLVDMRDVADTVSPVATALLTGSVSTYPQVLDLATASGLLDPALKKLTVDAIVNRWTDNDPRSRPRIDGGAAPAFVPKRNTSQIRNHGRPADYAPRLEIGDWQMWPRRGARPPIRAHTGIGAEGFVTACLRLRQTGGGAGHLESWVLSLAEWSRRIELVDRGRTWAWSAPEIPPVRRRRRLSCSVAE